ncbi:MAG TPA: VCBS repeat-containing protein [Polyangiaceae bacterium]|nr:VCBS repeat-containing protein [Polyangiaceae bacterium]
MSPRLFSLVLAVSAIVACAQRDEIIAVAPDDDAGGGGVGGVGAGGSGAGGGEVVTPVTLEPPDCGGTVDGVTSGSVDAGAGDDVVVGGDGCAALYRGSEESLSSPEILGFGEARALGLGRLETLTPAASGEPVDLVMGGAAVEIWLGDGAGSFAPHQVIVPSMPLAPGGLALADIGGDGALDLVTAEGPELVLRFGLGDGTFGPEHPFAAPGGARSVVVGRLDGDALADVIVAGDAAALFVADGVGGFHMAQPIEGGDHVGAVAIGHLDDDGCLDAVGVEGRALQAGAPDALAQLWLGDCDGHLVLHQSIPVAAPTAVALGDFGDDGHRDVAITRDGGVTLLTLDAEAAVAAEHAVDLDGAPRGAAFVDGRLVVVAGDRVVLLHAL